MTQYYLSGYRGVGIKNAWEVGYAATGFIDGPALGGADTWAIGPEPSDAAEGLLWSTPYTGKRYAYVFVPDDGPSVDNTGFFGSLLDENPLPDFEVSKHTTGGLTHCVIQTDSLLPGWDEDAYGYPEPGSDLWQGLGSEVLEGGLRLIDLFKDDSPAPGDIEPVISRPGAPKPVDHEDIPEPNDLVSL